MKPKVVIIGYGFATRLGLIRSLSQISDHISVVMIESDKSKPVDCYSKYVHAYYRSGNNEEKLMEILKGECVDNNQKVILIPTNDFSASALDRNIGILNDSFLFPHIHFTPGAITEWMDKERQKSAARNVGLNVACSNNVEIKNGDYVLPAQINYPCFTKTRACVTTGYKHTLHKCEDEKELRSFLDGVSKRFHNITIMVEDYKEISTEYAVVGFSDGNEVVIPGVIEITMMAKGIYKGIACQGKIMPVSGFEDVVEKFKKLIRSIGFEGLFDIDFYLSNGDYYFGEINMRIGGSGYAATKMGVNLPEMFVKSLLNESIDNAEKGIKASATFVNERICLDNWNKGYISTKRFRQILKTADISFLKDKEDVLPEKVFKRRMVVMSVKRYLKKFVKKS